MKLHVNVILDFPAKAVNSLVMVSVEETFHMAVLKAFQEKPLLAATGMEAVVIWILDSHTLTMDFVPT